MQYDKNSFLAGVAAGRQLKGWSAAGSLADYGKYTGWTVNAPYLRTAAGRLGGWVLAGEGLTLERDVPFTAEAGVSVSGNTITMTGGGRFAVDSGFFAVGDEICARLTVSALWQLLPAALNGYGAWPADVAASGNWYLRHMGQPDSGWDVPECAATGSGEIRFTKDYPSQTLALRPTDAGGGGSAAAFATVRLDSLTVSAGCFKSREGCCAAAFVRYTDAGGDVRLTPCLVSGVQHFTYYAAARGGQERPELVTSHTLDGITFYMAAERYPALDSGRALTGAPLLDLTGGGAVSDRDELFAAVAAALGLAVYHGR